MFDDLTGLGYGIIIFAVILVIGTVILVKLGTGVAVCQTGWTFSESLNVCANNSNTSQTATATGAAYTNANYMTGQLGSSGLAGWTPAIIAFAIGMMFLGAFFVGKGKRR